MSDLVSTSAPAAAPRPEAPIGKSPPDVVVAQGNGAFTCSIDEEALLRIRQRAAKLIWKAGEAAYAFFPIDRADLYRKIAGVMLTEKNICQTLGPLKATEQNHNDLREQYNSERLDAEAAAKLGLVGMRMPLVASCPEGYDWKNSPVYAGADSCEDVTEEFALGGMPTAMYSTELGAADATDFLAAISTAPFYTRYAGEGPVPCAGDPSGQSHFHDIHVWATISAEFAMRTHHGAGWSAWTLLSRCTTPDGEEHRSTDLMFDFGIRTFVPLEVEIDGGRVARTLVISQIAATTETVLAKLVPQAVPLERFYGGEYAKKILLEAKARNWKIEKKK